MVVGAPGVRLYPHASDGSAWSSRGRGSVAEASFESKKALSSTRIQTVAEGWLDLFQ